MKNNDTEKNKANLVFNTSLIPSRKKRVLATRKRRIFLSEYIAEEYMLTIGGEIAIKARSTKRLFLGIKSNAK